MLVDFILPQNLIKLLVYYIRDGSELDIIGKPIAYYRKGDSQELLSHFKENNCETEEHKFGYRSVHYLVKSSLFKKQYIVEIQVRTIFEEGWSEVDHKLKYPYVKNNVVLERFIGILNRLAGSTDEMCSFINYLQLKITEDNQKIIDQDQTISNLKNEIDKLQIETSKKDEIKHNIDGLGKMFVDTSALAGTIRTMQHSLGAINIPDITNATKIMHDSIVSAGRMIPPTSPLASANFGLNTNSTELNILPKTQIIVDKDD